MVDHVIDAIDETGAPVAKALSFKNSACGFERCITWLESLTYEPNDA
ncbi:hypothetical protein [Lancefieldella rimae]